MLGNRSIEDAMSYEAKDYEIGDTIGRIDPARINQGLFEELGVWDENSQAEMEGMDDEDYEHREESSALALSQMYERQLMDKVKNGMTNEDGQAEFRGYQNKLSKYQSIFGRMQNKLVGKAIKQANDMYGVE